MDRGVCGQNQVGNHSKITSHNLFAKTLETQGVL